MQRYHANTVIIPYKYHAKIPYKYHAKIPFNRVVVLRKKKKEWHSCLYMFCSVLICFVLFCFVLFCSVLLYKRRDRVHGPEAAKWKFLDISFLSLSLSLYSTSVAVIRLRYWYWYLKLYLLCSFCQWNIVFFSSFSGFILRGK